MRIKHLLFLLMALPLAFVSCKESEQIVDEVKNPTVAITVGEATETSITFTITSTDADEVKYLVVESTEATPTATEVLTNGAAVEANTEAGCYIDELEAETEYTIVAAAKNSKAVVKAEAKMATKGNGEEPVPPTPGEFDVEFTAQDAYVAYYGDMYSAAYNYYIVLSDNGVELTENDIDFKDNSTYYLIDLYATDAAENNNFTVPNGTYKADSTSAAGTFGLGDYGAGLSIVEGVPTYYIYAAGEVVVSDNKIVATITMEDGQKHQITYEGSLYFGEGGDTPNPPAQDFEATHTATKWLWGGSSSYGNKYAVMGDNFSIDVHFPAKYATQTYLEQQTYIWTSTTWFGYNDFENEFTTRSFKVDGTDVAVDGGAAVVTATGDEYHIELTLEGRDGFVYMIQYDGKLDDKGEVVDDNSPVAFTYMSKGTYTSSFWCYQYELTNEKGDTMTLYINDTQGNETNIYTDDSFIWTTRDYCYYAGDFSTHGIVVNGMSYDAISGAMNLSSDGAGTISFTMTLNFTNGTSREFSFAGKIGQENTGGEVTKLATPSVSGIVSGNAATISWQEIAGAKNYTVTLNGGNAKTVETAYITYQNLDWETTYSVSVVANPADTAVNTASDPGTATFTTEANPGGGEGGGNTGGESFENWVFDASLNMGAGIITVTDGSHTVEFTLNQVGGGKFYIFDNGVLNITKVVVNGVETTDASGTVDMSSNNSYYIVLDCYINGVHYTGTSNNPVA
ncbi:MAG: hypothetical protein IKW31_04530 [Alistipes sp.]|nr:hypothetical protein [Alistipes sp.]